MTSQAQSNNPANSQTETTKWLQTRFESLFTVSSSSAQPLPPHSPDPSEQADFRALFFSTFSEDVKIVRNHQSVSVDGWLGELVGKTTIGGSAGGRIEWRDIVENTVEGQDNVQIVAGLFVVTRNLHIRIRAGPMQRLTYNTFSAKIEPMTDAIEGTQRRITELWITSVDKAAPIHLRGIPLVQQQQEGENSINPELLREQH